MTAISEAVTPIKNGRWICRYTEDNRPYTVCDVCYKGMRYNGEKIDLRPFKYCPNCGAKMDEEDIQ